eukprot:82154_1
MSVTAAHQSGAVPPRISANFGFYPFAHPPRAAFACDTFILYAQSGEGAPRPPQQVDSRNVENQAQLQNEMWESRQKSEPSQSDRRELAQEMREIFTASEPKSFSNFPPRRLRMHQAISVMQSAVKHWLWRRRFACVLLKKHKSARVLQRMERRRQGRAKKKRERAAIVLQRRVRGVLDRKTVKIYKRAGYRRTQQSIVRVQACVRGYQSRKNTREVRALQKIQNKLRGAAMDKICTWLRPAIRRRRMNVRIVQVKAALQIQRIWRGHIARRNLQQADHALARRLSALGARLSYSVRSSAAALVIQCAFRKFHARRYAALRRKVLKRAIGTIYRGWIVH